MVERVDFENFELASFGNFEMSELGLAVFGNSEIVEQEQIGIENFQKAELELVAALQVEALEQRPLQALEM